MLKGPFFSRKFSFETFVLKKHAKKTSWWQSRDIGCLFDCKHIFHWPVVLWRIFRVLQLPRQFYFFRMVHAGRFNVLWWLTKEIFSNPHIRLIWKTRGFYLNKYWHPYVCFDRETVKTRRDFHEETWVCVSQSIISQNNDFLSSNNAFRILQRIVIPIGKSPHKLHGCSIHRLKIKKK